MNGVQILFALIPTILPMMYIYDYINPNGVIERDKFVFSTCIVTLIAYALLMFHIHN